MQGRRFHLVQYVSTDISVWCMYSSQQLIVTSLLEPTWETHLLALQVWGVVVQRLQCQSSSERTRACVHMMLSRDMGNFFHLTNCFKIEKARPILLWSTGIKNKNTIHFCKCISDLTTGLWLTLMSYAWNPNLAKWKAEGRETPGTEKWKLRYQN